MMGPHYEALGWTLVHVGWQASVVTGLYAMTELFRLKPNARYVIGLISILTILALAVATFVYEDLRLSARPDATVFLTFVPSRDFSLTHLMPWLDAAWIMGVAVMSGRMALSLWFINRLSYASEAAPDSLMQRMSVVARRVGVNDKIGLRIHPSIDGPFVVGAFRSVIYLPVSALTALAPDQLDAVLAHELEHIRRADYVWNLVQGLIATLLFFHPAVWWLGSRLREQRELCCDDAALRACSDPVIYATALLSLEEHRRPTGTPAYAMALNGQDGGRGLMGRIARMLGEKADMPRKHRPSATLALPVLLLVLAFFMTPVAKVAAAIQPKAMLAAVTGQQTQVSPQVIKVRSEVRVNVTTTSDTQDVSDIDPDAIAADARAAAEKAKAEMTRAHADDIDVDAIVAEARRAAEQARQDMQRQGLHADIDMDAIVAQARTAAEQAKTQMAMARNIDIDVDAIAEQARAAAEQAKVQVEFGQRFGRGFRKTWTIDVPDDPTTPETPAPVMDDKSQPAPASPLAAASPVSRPAAPAIPAAPKPPAVANAALPPAPSATSATVPAPPPPPKVTVRARNIRIIQQS